MDKILQQVNVPVNQPVVSRIELPPVSEHISH